MTLITDHVCSLSAGDRVDSLLVSW